MIVVILILAGYASYKTFQVREVLVAGNEEYESDYIAGLADIPDETLMIKVDEEKIKENIESNPFLELVSVDYELPETVVLMVAERKPAVVLSYAGNTLLLDRQLNVLKMDAAAEAANFPELQGVAPEALNLGKQIQTADTFKVTVATDILDALKNLDALGMISVIDLTDINNIRLVTKEGPDVLFGQSDQPEEKVRWMKRILPSLIEGGNTMGELDVSAGTFATYRGDGDTGVQGGDTPGTQPESDPENDPETDPGDDPDPENEPETEPETDPQTDPE